MLVAFKSFEYPILDLCDTQTHTHTYIETHARIHIHMRKKQEKITKSKLKYATAIRGTAVYNTVNHLSGTLLSNVIKSVTVSLIWCHNAQITLYTK